MMDPRLIERHDVLDRIFVEWRLPLRERYEAYRGHAYRVLNLTLALLQGQEEELTGYGRPQDVEARIAVAAAFHDADFVFEGNGDYLDPSREQAVQWLKDHGNSDWAAEVGLMIVWHHKLTSYAGDHGTLVEAFRKADFVDLSLMTVRYGIPGAYLRKLRRVFPNNGFHILLAKNLSRYALSHPLKPLPMMRR